MERQTLPRILKVMQKEASGAPVFLLEKTSERSPFEILIGTMLSARTRDITTARILPELFETANNPNSMLNISVGELEKTLYGIGFYRVKARRIKEISKILVDRFGGNVPPNIDDLLSLPGVGRKTANIVLARAFGKNTLGVDVHVHRISNRLGLVKTKKPEETEKQLLKILSKNLIKNFNKTLVAYGQMICLPVKPLCSKCKLNTLCPKIGVKSNG